MKTFNMDMGETERIEPAARDCQEHRQDVCAVWISCNRSLGSPRALPADLRSVNVDAFLKKMMAFQR